MADLNQAFLIQPKFDNRFDKKQCSKCKKINQYSITDDGDRECKCKCGNYFWKHGVTKNCECFDCLDNWDSNMDYMLDMPNKQCIKCNKINQYTTTNDGNKECKCFCGNYFWKHGVTANCECFECNGKTFN